MITSRRSNQSSFFFQEKLLVGSFENISNFYLIFSTDFYALFVIILNISEYAQYS